MKRVHVGWPVIVVAVCVSGQLLGQSVRKLDGSGARAARERHAASMAKSRAVNWNMAVSGEDVYRIDVTTGRVARLTPSGWAWMTNQ